MASEHLLGKIIAPWQRNQHACKRLLHRSAQPKRRSMPSPPFRSPSTTPSEPLPDGTLPPPPSPAPGTASSAPPPPGPHMSLSSVAPTSASLAPSWTALPLASPSSKSLASTRTPSPTPFRSPSLDHFSSLRSLFLQFNSLTRSSSLSTTFSPVVSPLPFPALSASSTSPPTPSPAPFRTTSPSPPPASNSLISPSTAFAAPYPLPRLHSLLYLWLDWNRLEGPILAILANCSSLLHLGLQGNDLQGILPVAFPVMHSLQVLSLSFSQNPPPLTTSFSASTTPAHLETPALVIDHKFIISGGQLFGHVHINGSKNAALAILAGSLRYATGSMVIRGMPNLYDTRIMAAVLHAIGAWVEEAGGGEVVVDAIKS